MDKRLIDTNLWIDFFRRKTSPEVKAVIEPWVMDWSARICEPVSFELLRESSGPHRKRISAYFETILTLNTPANLWKEATDYGHRCRDEGVTPGSLDLLIATLAIHHDAELITFDTGFTSIARCLPLRLRLLTRPT